MEIDRRVDMLAISRILHAISLIITEVDCTEIWLSGLYTVGTLKLQ